MDYAFRFAKPHIVLKINHLWQTRRFIGKPGRNQGQQVFNRDPGPVSGWGPMNPGARNWSCGCSGRQGGNKSDWIALQVTEALSFGRWPKARVSRKYQHPEPE